MAQGSFRNTPTRLKFTSVANIINYYREMNLVRI